MEVKFLLLRTRKSSGQPPEALDYQVTDFGIEVQSALERENATPSIAGYPPKSQSEQYAGQ